MSIQPAVYINQEGHIAFVTHSTANTLYTIEIDSDTVQWDTKSHSVLNFLKEFSVTSQDLLTTAQKIINSNNLTCSEQAKTQLKEIIMKTACILVVSPSVEFIGRFADAKSASKVAPAASIIINNADELEQFSKEQLAVALNLPSSKEDLKGVTKKELASKVFEEYLTKEATIVEKPAKKTKEPKEAKPAHESKFSKIIASLVSGSVLNLKELMATYDTSEGTIRSIISNMRSVKYMGDTPIVEVQTGKVNGETVFFLEAFKPELDLKSEPKVRTASGEPKAKGIKTIIRELLTDGSDGYTMDELLEKTGAEKKIISDMLAYLKNPKYCGADGPLTIVRDPETKKYIAIDSVVDPEDLMA